MEEPAFDDLRTKKQLGYVAYGRTILTKSFSLESILCAQFSKNIRHEKESLHKAAPPLVKRIMVYSGVMEM